jgi:hypothetical protein
MLYAASHRVARQHPGHYALLIFTNDSKKSVVWRLVSHARDIHSFRCYRERKYRNPVKQWAGHAAVLIDSMS